MSNPSRRTTDNPFGLCSYHHFSCCCIEYMLRSHGTLINHVFALALGDGTELDSLQASECELLCPTSGCDCRQHATRTSIALTQANAETYLRLPEKEKKTRLVRTRTRIFQRSDDAAVIDQARPSHRKGACERSTREVPNSPVTGIRGPKTC